MRRVSIENPSVDRTYKTYVDSDYSSGTVLTVKANTSFAANDLIIIGEPQEELTELKQVSSVSGGATINLSSALTYSHPKGSPVYRVLWNFVSIERKTSSAGTFSEITQSGIQWDSKTNETIYFDRDATNAYQYRFRFYNSVTATYSEYSATVTGAIPSRKSVQAMIDYVRKIAGDLERKVASDDEIIRIFNQGQDIIYAHNPKYFFLYVDTFERGSGSIAATTNEDVYTLGNLTNYGHLSGLKYRYISGADNVIYQLKRESEVEFDRIDSDQNTTDDNWPTTYKLLPADSSSDNGYFKVTPDIKDSNIGTFYPLYYEKMADLTTVADTTQIPLPMLLENLAIGYIFRIKGNEGKARIYESYLIPDRDDRNRIDIVPRGLLMLDKLDAVQRKAVGQPQNLVVFKGQRAIKRLFGNKYPGVSLDYIRENYF